MSNTAVKVVSISVSLLASGGIATLSLFDIPELRAQPASRSLPSIRWLFSRGSHVFPSASLIASSGFAYLAYDAAGNFGQLMRISKNAMKVNGYLSAAALTFSIALFTQVMLPTNFELIRMNMKKGGARSEKSARSEQHRSGKALDSSLGKGEAAEFSDLGGPPAKTEDTSSDEDDEKVKELLDRFGKLNFVRAVLIGAGGVVGLWTALAF